MGTMIMNLSACVPETQIEPYESSYQMSVLTISQAYSPNLVSKLNNHNILHHQQPNMARLTSKVCIITGSSSSLGRAIALTYATEGAHIVCADLQTTARAEVESESLANTDDLIRQNGGKAIFI
ncbi:putative oxidoreductase YxbG [Colletotrichum viniferum]|nr:putative oxidoreductase YxbG [Colletotrichum viniferum]